MQSDRVLLLFRLMDQCLQLILTSFLFLSKYFLIANQGQRDRKSHGSILSIVSFPADIGLLLLPMVGSEHGSEFLSISICLPLTRQFGD